MIRHFSALFTWYHGKLFCMVLLIAFHPCDPIPCRNTKVLSSQRPKPWHKSLLNIFWYGVKVLYIHDDVIKWKHFPRYWPSVQEIHRSPVNSLHKGQWRGILMFSLICARIHGWVNNCETDDLRRYRTHCDVIVMILLVRSQDRAHPMFYYTVNSVRMNAF